MENNIKKQANYSPLEKIEFSTDFDLDRTSKDNISLCMIAKNEEANIARCLQIMRPVVDEIIVVDTGSTDRTKDIAKSFGAKVYDFIWTNSFSDARNYSLSKALGKWILVLDADEVISPSNFDELRKLVKETSPKPVAFSFQTRNYVYRICDGWSPNDREYAEEAGTGWFPTEKVRLFPNAGHIRFESPVHEFVEPFLIGARIDIKKCDIPIHHYGMLNREKGDSKGHIYYSLGKRKLSEKGSSDAQAIYEIAKQASALGKHEESVEYWKKLISLKPNFAPAFYGIGVDYFNLTKLDDARMSFKKALQLDPNLNNATVFYGMCEIFAGNIEIAIACLEDLVAKHSKYATALLPLAVAYFCRGERQKGMECIRELRDTNLEYLDSADYFINFAKMLLSAKQLSYAILLLEGAMECHSVTDETHVLLAECYKKRQLNESGQI
jgi:glycosyltransferase involved in cell wall biosynthesis